MTDQQKREEVEARRGRRGQSDEEVEGQAIRYGRDDDESKEADVEGQFRVVRFDPPEEVEGQGIRHGRHDAAGTESEAEAGEDAEQTGDDVEGHPWRYGPEDDKKARR